MGRRIRTIKPEILDSESTMDLTDPAWRLFVSMWTIADDYGSLAANEGSLSAQVFWSRNKVPISELLAELELHEHVRGYIVRGRRLIYLTKFRQHQRIDKRGEAKVPKFEDAELFFSFSPNIPGTFQESSLHPPRLLPSGREGRGEEGKGEEAALPPPERRFEEPTPDPLRPVAIALALAWPNARLSGTPTADQMLESGAVKDLLASGFAPADALKAWRKSLDEWAERGIRPKQSPAKFAEHLRTGVIVPEAKGSALGARRSAVDELEEQREFAEEMRRQRDKAQ